MHLTSCDNFGMHYEMKKSKQAAARDEVDVTADRTTKDHYSRLWGAEPGTNYARHFRDPRPDHLDENDPRLSHLLVIAQHGFRSKSGPVQAAVTKAWIWPGQSVFLRLEVTEGKCINGCCTPSRHIALTGGVKHMLLGSSTNKAKSGRQLMHLFCESCLAGRVVGTPIYISSYDALVIYAQDAAQSAMVIPRNITVDFGILPARAAAEKERRKQRELDLKHRLDEVELNRLNGPSTLKRARQTSDQNKGSNASQGQSQTESILTNIFDFD